MPLFGRWLGSGLAKVALRAIDRLKRKEDLTADEEYAVERLCSWLARVQGADPLLDEALDDAQREFLLSYRLPAPEADTPGGGRRSIARTAPRQYILPARSGARTPRGSCGSAADLAAAGGEPSRHSSEEGEALLGTNDPEVERMLRALEDWEAFDVFRLAELTDGRPLQTVALGLLRRRGLLARLCLPEDRLRNFLADVEEAYHPGNPYHNSTHAADVVQALGAMLAADSFSRQLSDLEQLAVILAAAVHDVGHPGVNNDFLIRTQSEAAVAYNDQSINENMHGAAAFKLLAKKENNFLSRFSEEDYRFVRRLIIRIILATDMARHTDGLEDFAASLRLWGPDLGAWTPDKRTAALQLVVHAADISNPARPLPLCRRWGQKVHDELFAQGDKEAALGLAVSFICDRRRASVPQSQLTFVEYVVKPCFSTLGELAPNFVAKNHTDCIL
ncbi:3, 5 -cyclic phosphodiesterase pde-4 [Chlorella sorokiniana]|uniref:Phosphodiesterase n=1 Tax=Chlorella sorokiniana TaxID=3076 RepID=A0A2P6TRY0_CHLSO|nr:3, 5 -cyclic phosphodiesterase pde-4 [Chlorella sorokiniana]|eukprot:PRW56816.1 3, 5 -cyclic phosphodiesterase pde-4 [Chlorella sorokiniana]